jgi:DNA mismatch repair protein MutS
VDKSYGVHVAKLAGLPKSVVHRAQEVLSDLESNNRQSPLKRPFKTEKRQGTLESQISLFGQKPQVVVDLEKLDLDSLTPLDALNKLYELQQKAKKG